MVKDMNNHFPIIQKNPASFALPFYAQREKTFFGQLSFDMGGNGLDLAVRIPATNHKVIGEGRKVLNRQDDQVDAFMVQRRPSAEESFFFRT